MKTTIPFKLLSLDGEGYHLMIKAYVNKKVANLIIDTGASKTVFDKKRVQKFVSESKIDAHEKLSSGLGTSNMESHVVVLKTFKIGEIEMKEYQTVLLDLSHVNQSYEQIGLKPVEGVLGSDVLLRYNAVIDYEKKLLRLSSPKKKK